MKERKGFLLQPESMALTKEVRERLERVTSAFNTSPQAIITLRLSSSLEYGRKIEKRLGDLYQGTEIEKWFLGGILKSYMQTLIDMGIVWQDSTELDRRGKVLRRFALTDFGLLYGQPIAAAFVDFEQRRKESFNPILGQTAVNYEGKNRAPITRSLTLLVLRNGGKSIAEIERALVMYGITKDVIAEAVVALSQAGMVAYRGLRRYMPWVEYGFTNIPAQGRIVHTEKKTLVSRVVDICEEIKAEGGSGVTRRMVYARLPGSIKENRDRRIFLIEITTILRRLEGRGYLERGLFKGGEKYPDVELTGKGELLVDEFILPLTDALSGGEILPRWREDLLPCVKKDLSFYAQETGRLYYPHSKSGRKEQHQQDQASILSLLEEEGASAKPQTVYQLSVEAGVPLRTLKRHLKGLLRDGKISRVVVDGRNCYFRSKS